VPRRAAVVAVALASWIAYLVLAVAATWPLARDLHAWVPHDLADPLLVTYLLNWNATVPPLTEAWWHAPFFWPAQNVTALSEHLLGLSLFATPLRWSGLSPVATYNVLFIASFWTAGIGGWILGWTLTGSATAAFISGLVFMCAPYRAARLPHLQMLVSCAIPVLFAALHRAREHGGWRWVVLAAACWLWQGLVSGYYLAFLPIAAAIWLAWFAARDWRLWARLGLAAGAGGVAIAPILVRYATVHAADGHRRGIGEVLLYSADVAGLWHASPYLAFWGRRLPGGMPEEQLFAGIATLTLAGLAARRIRRGTGSLRWLTIALLVIAGVFAVAAAVTALAPGTRVVAGMSLAMHSPHKPLSVVWLALIASVLSTRTVGSAWTARAPAAGYLLLLAAAWILALGPEPTLYETPVWYAAPYLWLYEIAPGFSEFRVPARFWMIALAALSGLSALGTVELMRIGRRLSVPIIAALGLAIVAEGWMSRMPLVAVPVSLSIPAEAVAVLELPTPDAQRDATAMYRSLSHGRPVINGWSGYAPPSHARAMPEVGKGDAAPLIEWTRLGPIAVVVDLTSASAEMYEGLVRGLGATCDTQARHLVCVLPYRNTTASAPAP
jgi:hypothetical protein